MKKRRSAEAIIGILREAEAGAALAEVCRKHGISEQTLELSRFRRHPMSWVKGENDAEDQKALCA